ncbi:hypothetical protein A1O7_01701 [Cladophialophora yegresii CBS 114405]|uniref:Uncharacterized protein n=1 Tax=Cladophialophora yegresii CBS 114405 TaxID=1182544 RepID=W9WK59_9EURO|nr:uncharacterized protein A1O7_01701 [Cladophialophora yegresii CBS 114405]EXJ65360.1 hypothetical protein A1O7_01701 [Cladophialophora yegresii CBS 114405]
MSPRSSAGEDMLSTYLYATRSVADRLVDGTRRVLRSDKNKASVNRPTAITQGGQENEKGDDFAVTRLEKEMDKITDRVLLSDAQAYQRGLQDGTLSYA